MNNDFKMQGSSISRLIQHYEVLITNEKDSTKKDSVNSTRKDSVTQKTDSVSQLLKTGQGNQVVVRPSVPSRPLSEIKGKQRLNSHSKIEGQWSQKFPESKPSQEFSITLPKTSSRFKKEPSNSDDPSKNIEKINTKINGLNLLQRKVQIGLLGMNKEAFKEELYTCHRDLYSLKHSLTSNEFNQEIAEMEKKLQKFDTVLPKFRETIKNLDKAMGSKVFKPTLAETLASICEKFPTTVEERGRDSKLFSCKSEIELNYLYAQRIAKSQNTGYSLSTVTSIERTWQKQAIKGQMETKVKLIDGQRVVFIPKDGAYIKEKMIGEGTFKAAFLATNYFAIDDKSQRNEIVILQSKEAIHAEVLEAKEKNKKEAVKEELTQKPVEKQKSQTSATQEDEISDSVVIHDEGEISGSVVLHDDEDEISESTIIHGDEDEISESTVIHDDEDATSQTSVIKKYTNDATDLTVDTDEKTQETSRISSSIIEPELSETEAYNKEAQLCLELGHLPGIWPTYKVTDIEGHIAIFQPAAGYVLEPIPGKRDEAKTIYEFHDMSSLYRLNLLSPKDRINYLKMIDNFLEGVESLHSHGYIHRDLKPNNVLCSKEGTAGVIDFGGCCKIKGDPEKLQVFGSPHYMAPEIINWPTEGNRAQDISTKADIWSVGIILWEMATGHMRYEHPAHNGDSATQVRLHTGQLGKGAELEHHLKTFLSKTSLSEKDQEKLIEAERVLSRQRSKLMEDLASVLEPQVKKRVLAEANKKYPGKEATDSQIYSLLKGDEKISLENAKRNQLTGGIWNSLSKKEKAAIKSLEEAASITHQYEVRNVRPDAQTQPLEYLCWQCSRIDPRERPDITTVRELYKRFQEVELAKSAS